MIITPENSREDQNNFICYLQTALGANPPQQMCHFSCQCEDFYRSGDFCPHVLLVAVNVKKSLVVDQIPMTLSDLLQVMPGGARHRGRPPKKQSGNRFGQGTRSPGQQGFDDYKSPAYYASQLNASPLK